MADRPRCPGRTQGNAGGPGCGLGLSQTSSAGQTEGWVSPLPVGPRGRDLLELGVQAETDLSATLWTLAGAYTVVRRPEFNLDILLGFRYLEIDEDLKWQFVRDAALPELDRVRAGRSSVNKENWDAIAGVKGQIFFGQTPWFMPYYLDIGTGDSDWTWQALLGIAYRFDWGNVNLSIRSLSYEFDEADADLRFTGPALGVSFVW